MTFYRAVGEIPRQRHVQHRAEDGTLFFEELMGEEGFSSDSSLLYHRGVPSALVDSQVWELADQSRTPNHPLKARHLKLHDLDTPACPVEGRRLVLGNNDVRIAYVVTGTDPSPLYRNALGDECVYVETGSGTVETVFGVVDYRAGDYVVVPRATPTGGCRRRPAASTPSRPTPTSTHPSGTCPASASSSSTRRTASATCTVPPGSRRWWSGAAGRTTSRCWSSIGSAARSSAPG